MELGDFLYAILMGIVEGITEWLPVSSTGHMLLLDHILHPAYGDAFCEFFTVVIQLGAILAVALVFFKRLNPFGKGKSRGEKRAVWCLWGRVFAGVLPAMAAGAALKLLYGSIPDSPVLIASALIAYGVAFILIERLRADKPPRVANLDALTLKDAFLIGCFQALSVIPGTSRSGSCIIGGMALGVSRTVGTEFAFFMAIPVMAGASLVELASAVADGVSFSGAEIGTLAVGSAVAFLVSLAAIRFLTDFVKKHSFEIFGRYRIALGILILLLARFL